MAFVAQEVDARLNVADRVFHVMAVAKLHGLFDALLVVACFEAAFLTVVE